MSLPPRLPILDLAIKKAGGLRELGRALGINYQALQTWRRIPAERVRDIERVTGIPREKLRPDIFR
jgi:DNA-binding transcriptional regulator YdaS (Cro superfamily)